MAQKKELREDEIGRWEMDKRWWGFGPKSLEKGASHLNQKRKVIEYYNYSYLRFRGNTGSASCLNYKKIAWKLLWAQCQPIALGNWLLKILHQRALSWELETFLHVIYAIRNVLCPNS